MSLSGDQLIAYRLHRNLLFVQNNHIYCVIMGINYVV